MLVPLLLPVLLATRAAAAESTVYPVLNHNYRAGSMVVTQKGDTIGVRYVFTDRNRGTRTFTRYVLRGDRPAFVELRAVLADDQLGDVSRRIEIVGDSIRDARDGKTVTRPLRPRAYPVSGFSPFDQLMLVRYLLRQPAHKAPLSGDS
jgi:hypothetical protein